MNDSEKFLSEATSRIRRAQIALVDSMPTANTPAIVGGDFNVQEEVGLTPPCDVNNPFFSPEQAAKMDEIDRGGGVIQEIFQVDELLANIARHEIGHGVLLGEDHSKIRFEVCRKR
jgi:hypothetical protein